MSRSRDKGTRAETALVAALSRLGFGKEVERRTLSGSRDKGDIAGIPGLVFEAKDAQVWNVSSWLRETETERINAGADYGILVIKVPGVGYQNAEKWLTVMDGPDALHLMERARWLRDDGLGPRLRTVERLRTVKMGGVGATRGLAEMVERERHCGTTPVSVWVTKRLSKLNDTPGQYHLMRLDPRCRMLLDAGYGRHAIIE